ncbi:MAG: hypothetical protein QOF90_1510 [Acetobacteraceae bacterium]|jgi:hypothetical protein|nr:hypothetical protein [Acetobacteraceae bacterium]
MSWTVDDPPPAVPSPIIWCAEMLLDGKLAVIGGDGSGIGEGARAIIARAVTENGAGVIIADMNEMDAA